MASEKGGIEKIRLYTDEELDLMDALDTSKLLEIIENGLF